MAILTIELLGLPRISLASQPLDPHMRKESALLAYLATEQAHNHSREALVGLLWPDAPEKAARNNLRVVLAGLRRLLGAAADAFLRADRQHLRFLPGSDHSLDAITFRRLLAEVRSHSHDALNRCDACVERLAQAVELYRGHFLDGFTLPDSAPFEGWVGLQREQLQQQALDALDTLAAAYELRGNYEAQCRYARRQLALEPWRETAYAQLMRGLWASGQRGAALEQYEICRHALAEELGLVPSLELTALYEELRAAHTPRAAEVGKAAPAERAIAAERPPLVNQLPAPLTPLIGRERALDALAALLRQPGTRLVSLVGVGGIGKTRLALHAAGELASRYADGAWAVELAALSDPALVPQAVAAALGVREETSLPLDQVLVLHLRTKQLLLVLDNCEHLANACRSLAEQLLRTCPRLTILATSREVLQIAGECVWPVPALAVPGPEVVAPASIKSHDSVRLFVERAAAANPAFALTASNAPALAHICRRLDGIPLAIELAAVRARHMTVAEIAVRLDDRFALLTAGSPTTAPRQRTLRAAIDWSYDLLTAEAQAFFRRLAVFASGWTLQCADAVCAVEQGDRGLATLELLSQLADKSLVIVEQRGNATRYRLLDTIRAYAHERLAAAGELAETRERHLAIYVRLAEEVAVELFAADQVAWLDRLALEHDNLRAAIDYAMKRADASAALRLVTALRSLLKSTTAAASVYLGDAAFAAASAEGGTTALEHLIAIWHEKANDEQRGRVARLDPVSC